MTVRAATYNHNENKAQFDCFVDHVQLFIVNDDDDVLFSKWFPNQMQADEYISGECPLITKEYFEL